MIIQQNRNMTIEESLSDERILFLGGDINNKTASNIVMRMLKMQSMNTKDITLYIFGDGNDFASAMAIYDTIQYLNCDVSTIGIGQATGTAALLLMAGTKGKRYVLPNAKIMLQQPWGSIAGQAEDINITTKHLTETKETINSIIVKHTGCDVDKVKTVLEREFYMNSQKAVEFGIADEIIEGIK